MTSPKRSPGRPKKRLTLAHVAEAAGVSIPTVSRMLNQSEDVSQETRERILQAMNDLGYALPAGGHANNKKKRKLSIAVITDYLNDYTNEIIVGVMDLAGEKDIRLLLCIKYTHDEVEQGCIKDVADGINDGIVYIGATHFLEKLRNQNIPFAIADCDAEMDAFTPSVSVTNWAGARLATTYLLKMGHRRIGLIKGVENSLVSQIRLEGYRAAIDSYGVAFDPALIRPGLYSADTGYTETLVLLDLPDPPTAIFAGSDTQALGVYQALYERNKRIPDQVSVIGFDDLPLALNMPPPLTTIRQPLREMGRIATGMVLSQIEGRPLDSFRMELPTILIERGSCAPRRE